MTHSIKMFFARLFWWNILLKFYLSNFFMAIVVSLSFTIPLWMTIEMRQIVLLSILLVFGIVLRYSIGWTRELPEYVVKEAERLFSEMLSIPRETTIKKLIEETKDSGNIKLLKEWVVKYKNFKKLNSEVIKLTNTIDDATEERFRKTQEKKALEERLAQLIVSHFV